MNTFTVFCYKFPVSSRLAQSISNQTARIAQRIEHATADSEVRCSTHLAGAFCHSLQGEGRDSSRNQGESGGGRGTSKLEVWMGGGGPPVDDGGDGEEVGKIRKTKRKNYTPK